MPRPSLLAAAAVLLLPAAALAQEYDVPATTSALVEYETVPKNPFSDENKGGFTVRIGPNRDDVTAPVHLPFPFQFYGTLYEDVIVADDGWLSFGNVSALAPVTPINPKLRSDKAPNAVAAPLWDALRTGAKGRVITFVSGIVTGKRTFVIAWEHLDTSDGDSRADLSFQVQLHEDTGDLDFAYAIDEGQWRGLSYTAGIEDESGTRARGAKDESNQHTEKPAKGYRFTTKNLVTISGVVTRDFPEQSAAGLGVTTKMGEPVRGADVRLVRDDNGKTVTTARTDDQGVYTLVVRGVIDTPKMSIDLLASGEESKVTNGAGVVYSKQIDEEIVPTGTVMRAPVVLDADVDMTNPTFRKVLAIQQAAHAGFDWIQKASAAAPPASVTKSIPQVQIVWDVMSAAPSGYSPASGTTAARITISDATMNPDAYDADIVLREYGQHVLNTIAPPPGAVTSHIFTRTVAITVPPTIPPTAQAEPVALADGFGWWFACAVLGRSQFWDTTSATATTVFDLEGPTPAATGANVAGAIAASLWDLSDPANEPADTFAGVLPGAAYAVFAAIDRRDGKSVPPSGSPSTIRTVFDDFTKAHAADGSEEPSQVSRIFIHHQTLPDDTATGLAFEPNDVSAEEKAFPATTSRLDGLTLNPFNVDRFSFTVGGEPKSASVSFSETAEVEVSIVGPPAPAGADETVYDTKSSVPGALSPLVVNAVAPGTYAVQIAWKSGPAVHYSLAIAARPALVSPLTKTLTAGTGYDFEVIVSGGIGTLGLSLDPPVAGLAFTGNRLIGRPATAGDFLVHVIAVDGSSTAKRDAGQLVLHVNPKLELVPTFAAKRDAELDAAVGRGGTNGAWTRVGPADVDGFHIADGTELRVTTAKLTAPFTVQASATDGAGAVVAVSPCEIVPCDPLATAARTSLDASKTFGYWFDALAGSTFATTIRFEGKGQAPAFRTLIDDQGTEVVLEPGALERHGGVVRIRGVVLERTSRHFVVFDANEDFSGKVGSARVVARQQRRVAVVGRGEIETVIRDEMPVKIRTLRVSFNAMKDAGICVFVRAGKSPVEPTQPAAILLKAASGGVVNPKTPIEVLALPLIAEYHVVANDGYVLTIERSESAEGPLAVEVIIAPPKNTTFELD